MKRLDDGATVSCSLNDEEFHERRKIARRTLLPRVAAARRVDNGLILRLKGGRSLRSEVDAFVTLERQCCQFLEFRILQEEDGPNAHIELRIAGQPEAAATIEIFAQAVGDYL